MTRMHNPPHPGVVLREYLGNITVTEAAAKLGVTRVTLSRVINCAAGISADMAYRLGDAFGTSPEFWAGMQLQYDLYQTGRLKRPKIHRLSTSLTGNPHTPFAGINVAVKIPADLVEDAKTACATEHRSVPKQIAYWARIGKAVLDNPDLPLRMIQDTMLSMEEVMVGKTSAYQVG